MSQFPEQYLHCILSDFDGLKKSTASVLTSVIGVKLTKCVTRERERERERGGGREGGVDKGDN